MAGRLGSTVASGPTGRVGHGFWLGQLRWISPAQSTTAPNLVTVQLTPGSDGTAPQVEQLAVQGRDVAREGRLRYQSPALLADGLDRTALCCGIHDEDKVAFAKASNRLQQQVVPLDGEGVYAWNEAVRGHPV